MHFDVPKVVRSPGCDHGHDEESQNGRDIKIDILEAYIWISEVFRMKSGFYRSTGRLPEPPPGGIWALVGFSVREERWPGLGRAPLAPSPNRTRRGGRRPPSFSLSSFPSRILFQLGKGGIILPVGVGLLLARPPPGRPHLPLLLYIRGQEAPLDTQVDPRDHILSRVQCPLPP